MAPASKPITSPVPEAWYPSLAALMLVIGLVFTASFFMFHVFGIGGRSLGFSIRIEVKTGSEYPYEATSSKRNRSIAKELTTGAVASVFLGFGSLFLLLATGVHV